MRGVLFAAFAPVWAAVPVLKATVFGSSVLQPMGRRRPRETASNLVRALASLARESSRSHQSGVFSIFSLSRLKRFSHSSSLVRPHSVDTAISTIHALHKSPIDHSDACANRIAGGGRHGAYGGAIGLELQHRTAADRAGLGTRRDRRSLHTQLPKIPTQVPLDYAQTSSSPSRG